MTEIQSEIHNKVGVITLNAEKSLNSLNLPMVLELQKLLRQWQQDDAVVCIFMQGAGEKAFCAGGDVRAVRNAIIAQQQVDATQLSADAFDFFLTEYEVDYAIHTYAKPIIVWGSGIVMGGGLGLLAGASHRVVTDKSMLAMPEVTIGLYPDVGGSWFLNKMPSAYGMYLGLTATRLDAADALFLKLADYCIASTNKERVMQLLFEMEWTTEVGNQIADVLQAVQVTTMPTSQAEAHRDFVKQFEAVQSSQEFDTMLSNNLVDDWVKAGYTTFKKGSPSSTAVILHQLQQSKGYTLEEVFQSELNLSCQCSLHPDFAEGVRALLVDKDQNPAWTPATIDVVSPDWVASYFTPLWNKDTHPLRHLKQ